MNAPPIKEGGGPTPEAAHHTNPISTQHCADKRHFIRVRPRVQERDADLGLPTENIVYDLRFGLS